ncbi:MAG: 4'-phosphopantetheinyl transferase superfamily protein [Clostridia bacterium]|nr:4'-phosphopantetheinyl transferase superfamily protein [Clostridia bacterium]
MAKVSLYIFDVKKMEKDVETYLFRLSKEQRTRADEYKIAKDRLRYIGGAYLVNEYTPDLPVSYGERGKPYKEGCFYNLSHSKDFAALAVSDIEVGIDLEAVRDIDDGFIKKVCSPKELEFVSSKKDFFTVWTMKESLLKCKGSGLISRLNAVPSIPQGVREYEGEKYFTKSFERNGYVISITLKTGEDFEIKIETI